MALRPEVEARVHRAEALAEQSVRWCDALEDSIDETIDHGNVAIPDEVWEDISIVNHAAALLTETDRVVRESQPPPFGRVTDSRIPDTRYSVIAPKKPKPRIVLVLPEAPAMRLVSLARDLRTYFETCGHPVAIRYGRAGSDDDLTPVNGLVGPAVKVELSDA